MSVKIDYAENCPINVLRNAFRLIYIHRQGTPINDFGWLQEISRKPINRLYQWA